MSVDMIIYRVQKLNNEEVQKISGMNVNELDGIDDWTVKAYPAQEVWNNPKRFAKISNFLTSVELMHTTTNHKACFVAHGMPENIQRYSWSYNSRFGGYTVCFGDSKLHVTKADMEKFTKTEKKLFCVVKQHCIDVDIDSWLAKTLRDSLDEMCYMPICLDDTTCKKLCSELIRLYDEGELYPNDSLVPLFIELMRARSNSDMFIEFQD